MVAVVRCRVQSFSGLVATTRVGPSGRESVLGTHPPRPNNFGPAGRSIEPWGLGLWCRFYEGAMTATYTADATDAAVHANIVAAGYGGGAGPR